MKIRRDIVNKEPIVGDTIVYNPPHYKGLVIAIIVGFAKSGLPIVVEEAEYNPNINYEKFYKQTPKTGFAILNR